MFFSIIRLIERIHNIIEYYDSRCRSKLRSFYRGLPHWMQHIYFWDICSLCFLSGYIYVNGWSHCIPLFCRVGVLYSFLFLIRFFFLSILKYFNRKDKLEKSTVSKFEVGHPLFFSNSLLVFFKQHDVINFFCLLIFRYIHPYRWFLFLKGNIALSFRVIRRLLWHLGLLETWLWLEMRWSIFWDYWIFMVIRTCPCLMYIEFKRSLIKNSFLGFLRNRFYNLLVICLISGYTHILFILIGYKILIQFWYLCVSYARGALWMQRVDVEIGLYDCNLDDRFGIGDQSMNVHFYVNSPIFKHLEFNEVGTWRFLNGTLGEPLRDMSYFKIFGYSTCAESDLLYSGNPRWQFMDIYGSGVYMHEVSELYDLVALLFHERINTEYCLDRFDHLSRKKPDLWNERSKETLHDMYNSLKKVFLLLKEVVSILRQANLQVKWVYDSTITTLVYNTLVIDVDVDIDDYLSPRKVDISFQDKLIEISDELSSFSLNSKKYIGTQVIQKTERVQDIEFGYPFYRDGQKYFEYDYYCTCTEGEFFLPDSIDEEKHIERVYYHYDRYKRELEEGGVVGSEEVIFE